MYVAAAGCMLLLRGWKIGQIQQLAMEKGEQLENIDAASAEPSQTRAVSERPARSKSNFVKRLFMWKNV